MRDLLLAAITVVLIPLILRSPFVGLLAWVWFGIMNPHRLAFGWAREFPFSLLIALCVFASLLLNTKQLRRPPVDGIVVAMVVFSLWLCVSPLVAIHPELEYDSWSRALKIQLMVLIAFFVLKDRRQLDYLTLVLAFSIGFFGIKGGIFTIITAGDYRVFGPYESFISDNNTLALALVLILPLFRYLYLHFPHRWVRIASLIAMPLCAVSAVASYSRGAILALFAMATFFVLKSNKNRVAITVLVLASVAVAQAFMPDQWHSRMATISEYEQDSSALGRINAWKMAWNLAVDRFPIGGGFGITEPDVFARYAPDPLDLHAAHSIYFQVLGEHGFVGLLLFLSIFFLAWRAGSWTIRESRRDARLAWAGDLAAMIQVGLAGYAVGGAFLSLTYFDLPYYLVVVLAITRDYVKRALEAPKSVAASDRFRVSPQVNG